MGSKMAKRVQQAKQVHACMRVHMTLFDIYIYNRMQSSCPLAEEEEQCDPDGGLFYQNMVDDLQAGASWSK